MKKTSLFISIIILVMAVALIYIVVYGPDRDMVYGETITVGATIFPLADIVKQIGDNKVEVVQVMPAGASPHTYSPTPAIMTYLSEAQVMFAIGHGLDDWSDSLLSAHDGMEKYIVDEGIDLRPSDDEEAAGGVDPHYWLSLTNAKIIAGQVAAKLSEIDPADRDYYEKNLGKYLASLEEADSYIRREIETADTDKLITFHDAWEYFAAEYGLEIVAVYEPKAGQEPTAKDLQALSNTVEKYNLGSIFVEPEFATITTKGLIGDLGLKTFTLDPLGGAKGRESYIGTMRADADEIVKGLNSAR